MSIPAFQWQTTEQRPGVFLHFAQRAGWQAGMIEQFDNEFRMRPAFPIPPGWSEFFYPSVAPNGPDMMTMAVNYFESMFETWLGQAGLRLTLPAMQMTWVEKDGQHYGMLNRLVAFVIHVDKGEWKFDCLLPFTAVKNDADYKAHWLEDKIATRNIRGDPTNPWYERDAVDYMKNKCELTLVSWLMQSAFMMRFEQDSLPVGPQV